MTHDLVEHGRLEPWRLHVAADEVIGDLMQPEQLEMVDQEGRGQHQKPADKRQAHNGVCRRRIGDVPDHCRDRPPLPEQQDECEAREQHVGAALDRLRNVLRPPLLEPWPRHRAVLHGKQRHQQEIDDERFRQRHGRTGVDGLRHDQTFDEADGIEKREKEHDIGCEPVEKCSDLGHDTLRVCVGQTDGWVSRRCVGKCRPSRNSARRHVAAVAAGRASAWRAPPRQ